MIVIDTSVWVDFIRGIRNKHTSCMEQMIKARRVYVGDVIMMEILQGFKLEEGAIETEQLLKEFTIINMCNPQLAIAAARNYRTLRTKGVTIRKSVDVLIGTCCIELGVPLLYKDRDFDPMVKHLKLKAVL